MPKYTPESCGWRQDAGGDWNRQGECIGWVDAADIYLESGAAYRAAQVAGRDRGDAITASEQTLRKRLKEKGYLATTDVKREVLTIRKTLAGSAKEVMHLHRSSLLPEASDADEELT